MSVLNVIGLGRVGLPTALMFAKSGLEVVGTDCNQELVSSLIQGKLSFYEDGLDTLFQDAQARGIEFSTQCQPTDMYILAVPTPYLKKSKKFDPNYVISALNTVLDYCKPGSIVIIESTVSPGTFDKYVRPVIARRGFTISKDVHLVYAPERILPGNLICELESNPRTIGADHREIGEKVKELYARFCTVEIVVTDIRTAEMTKVVENTYRDIAFANELVKICRQDNLDVYEVIRIANKHPRVNILQPGPGVGGHCIPVDPWFLVGAYPDLTNLILAARKVNESMPEYVLSRIRDIMREHGIKDIGKVGLYGLAYKENVADTRESPTLKLLERLEHLAFGVKVYDPYINTKLVEHQFFSFHDFLNEILILVIMVGHDHIKKNMALLRDKIIFDTRNICTLPGIYKL